MFIHSIIDKNTLSCWFPGFQVLPKNILKSESSVTYILSLSLPPNNKISLQVLFLPHQFYVLLLFYIHYIVFVWSNFDELSQYKKKLECSIPIKNLVLTKYFISQKVYACFIILPLLLEITVYVVHITIKNQNKGVVT